MLTELVKKFTENEAKIFEWLKQHRTEVRDPIYASVDIRNAGYKVAPVDTNLFPGGFNNLCPSYQRETGKLMSEYVEKYYPGTKKILIIPENHTRNRYYFSNIRKLENILTEAGFKVRTGSLNPEIRSKTEFATSNNERITLFPLKRIENKLKTDNFEADLYLLNNDLSSDIPKILKNLEMPLIPSPEAGWHIRRKSDHFTVYANLIIDFAKQINMDPWLLKAYYSTAENIDFGNKSDLEKLAGKIDNLIKKITQKHKEYKINEPPYVFIKNNSGTYGMGVTNARSGQEMLEANRKIRNKMTTGKESRKISSLIIQEGIPTTDKFKELVAEPVIYLANNKVAGGFFRLNEEKGHRSNLNSKGMKFTKLCFHEILGYSNKYEGNYNLEYLSKIYRTIGQIASIAAGYEIQELKNDT